MNMENSIQMMTYVLRNDDSGFPPSDKMILDIMCDPPSRSALRIESQYENAQKKTGLPIRFHAFSIGIFQATFEACGYIIPRTQSHIKWHWLIQHRPPVYRELSRSQKAGYPCWCCERKLQQIIKPKWTVAWTYAILWRCKNARTSNCEQLRERPTLPSLFHKHANIQNTGSGI